ncbi:Phage shock protein C [Polaribacter huanghezhanensis]|uniref:PspC domain-containing protein n=1 Tax=Polaribacter huanghezhanensis TaxID=1354726 RepID=UPI0026489082|nr:PspC domain-containing protein [Polaribacter huanghezhanensis]WKD86159.1 Phage shock protein C [Polaribacter huanghezhanensis]
MNKTININLGGFFFHIDEIAFQKLKRYLDSISRSLSDDPQGKNEIISDIEARISELLSEKITDARQVVNESDIDEVIKIMGQPEDYADAEEGYANEDYNYQRRRTSSSSGKKLFRDGDDKFLGGVASGIAHYFNVDTVWIRLAFILLAFSGFSIVTYIILWIVIPEAATTAEKLQMEGEAVNIDNIEKKIREEFSHVSETIKNSASEVSGKIKDGASKVNEGLKKGSKKATSGFQDFLDTLGSIILTIFKIIGKFIGVILMFVAAVTLISLIIGAFSIGSLEFLGFDGDFPLYQPFFYDSVLPYWLLMICAFLVIGIPFLILFVLGLRILSSNVKQFSKATSLTLFGIWLAAILVFVFAGIEFGTTKASSGNKIETIDLTAVANDTITLKMVKNKDFYYQYNNYRNNNVEVIYQGDQKKLASTDVYIDVEKSDSNKAYLQIRKSSEGRNKLNAIENAESISYNYKMEGNEILLDAYFVSEFKNAFKDEDVYIKLFIPNDVTVYFDDSTKSYLRNIENTTNTYDRNMVKHYFMMTDDGLNSKELKMLEDNVEE